MELAMVGEKIVPLDQAYISVHDRSVSFGDGVYEVLVCCGGWLFAAERHFSRLEGSLGKMGMLGKVDVGEIRRRVEEALGASGLQEAFVYFQISRGCAYRSHDYDEDWAPGFLLTVRERKRPGAGRTGRAITHPDWRWKRCDIKSLNLLANVLAKHAAGKAGAYEAILVDEKGMVTEGTSTTVLMIKDKVLQTAPLTANILPGITRQFLLPWAKEMGLGVREELFGVGQMMAAEELLITGTSTEVMGIVEVDWGRIGSGRLGSYTARLAQRLAEAMYGTG